MMAECNVCLTETKDLHECVACHELVCEECLVGILAPPHPLIDYNLCTECFKYGGSE